ncbi:unnamed protein product [Lactuca saligna]|uniref:Uncharacterized protein n=1 Tax=Lactuca saligna TaxID=75948 RepID=A0AA35ULF4_LACSI|nr:unnamed protein product [Lactuca saligna]
MGTNLSSPSKKYADRRHELAHLQNEGFMLTGSGSGPSLHLVAVDAGVAEQWWSRLSSSVQREGIIKFLEIDLLFLSEDLVEDRYKRKPGGEGVPSLHVICWRQGRTTKETAGAPPPPPPKLWQTREASLLFPSPFVKSIPHQRCFPFLD